jgi:hypothetical protein
MRIAAKPASLPAWSLPVLTAVVLLSGMALVLAPPTASRAQGEELSVLETWSSKELGIRLRPPKAWLAKAQDGPMPLILFGPRRAAVIAVQAMPLAPGGEDSAPPDLAEVTKGSIKSLKGAIQRFKLLSRRDVTVDGQPGVEIFFRGKTDGTQRRWVQTILLLRGRQVSLMYSVSADLYERFLGDYDQLVRSVRLTP